MARTGEFVGKDVALHDVAALDARRSPVLPGSVPAFPEGTADRGAGALVQRLRTAMAARRLPVPQVIRAEDVTLLATDLPVRGARQRRAALPFALEDRIAAPLEHVHCALGPALPGGGVLAAVVARALMEGCAPGPVLPETVAVPRPESGWAVWCAAGRAVVRVDDGTGFAVRADLLPGLWVRAGRPALARLGGPLPDMGGVAIADLSAAPAPVAPEDLGFDLAQGAFATDTAGWARTWRTAGIAAGAAVVAHLGLLAVDRIALGRMADAARADAQAAIAPVLPGVTLGREVAPVLARLAPAADTAGRSDFLPLLSDVSAVLLDAGAVAEVRRMGWAAREGRLRLLLEAEGLEALQGIEGRLRDAGLSVSGGAATVADGAARTELTIARGAGG